MLTNRPRSFFNSTTIESGLSDHHKLTISVLKSFFQKQAPISIKYRDYKKFDLMKFRMELIESLSNFKEGVISYQIFENLFIELLNKHVPLKEKFIRANNSPFMNKTLSKAFMTRSRLRNKFLKNPISANELTYKRFRNFCTRLVRKEKKAFYSNLDPKLLTDNKKFWKTVQPLFSEKYFISKKITLLEGDKVITVDTEVAETMNSFFSNVTNKLDIQGFATNDFIHDPESNPIDNIIEKFRNHPSIFKIKEILPMGSVFHFTASSETDILDKINSLNIKKPTNSNNIPAKFLVATSDIISPFIAKLDNEAKSNSEFPDPLKMADITPIHKKDETTLKENYRPVSILPSISKIFERDMYEQISLYFENLLSPFLCGFRKGFSTQHCLIVMLERWKKGLDSGKVAGALLTVYITNY